MRRIINKIQELRRHQYFKLYAAVGVLVLAITAYLTLFHRGYIVVLLNQPQVQVLVDGKEPENAAKKDNRLIIPVWPGIHTVRIISPDTVEYAQSFTVYRGFRRTINPVLNVVPKASEKALGDVQFLASDQKNNAAYYLGENGSTIFKHDLTKNQRWPLTSVRLSGVQDINFAPNFKLAIVKKSDGFWLYDFGRYNLINIEPKKIAEFNQITMPAWDPLGNSECLKTNTCLTSPEDIATWRIAYVNLNDSEHHLFYANQLNQNPELVTAASGNANSRLRWAPNGKFAAYSTDNKIFILDIFTRTLKEMTFSQSVQDFLITKDSQRIVYQAVDQLTSVLLNNQEQTKLEFNSTINKLITLAGPELVAAIFDPKLGSDQLYKLNLETGEDSEYKYQTNEKLVIEAMSLSRNNSTLLFQSNNRLYSLLLRLED